MDNRSYLDRELTLRYLECAEGAVDNDELSACEREVLAAAEPRFCWHRYSIDECPVRLSGEAVGRHLDNCGSVILFAATLGEGVDRVIRRASLAGMTKALMCDAAAGAMIERYSEHCDRILADRFSQEYLTWRFSPGYADFPLSAQKELLCALDAPRSIGLYLNDSMLMIPQKSVTAVIGVSDAPITRAKMGCSACNMKDVCRFRREGRHCDS